MQLWQQIDSGKPEVSEIKLFHFLQDYKIVTERKQLDELFKQCEY